LFTYPGSGSDHCSIPDPDPRGKKAPDPGSATLVANMENVLILMWKVESVTQIESFNFLKKIGTCIEPSTGT
jgi:hypothetical protein